MAPFNMSSLTTFALLFSSFGIGSYGHLIMNSPVPFGVDTLNNSPMVDAKPGTAQSDFPCKQRPGVYDITAMNNMAVGDTQLLNFTGSASHGGGTCQIAITMDLEPTIHSVWKLIQVFEGGCPISADGNDGTHPFTFSIPKGFPNGRSTLSWTWYNRIGNREIYQNCAPIDITGGSDDKTLYDSLPEWYIINLPTSECSTGQNVDVIIPNPGQFIMQNTAEGNTLASASGPSCAASAATQTSSLVGYKTAIVENNAAYSAPVKNADVTGPAAAGASATNAASASGGSSPAAPAATSGSTQASSPVSSPAQAPSATSATSAPIVAPVPTQASVSDSPSASVAPSVGISDPTTGLSSANPPVATGGLSGGSPGTGSSSSADAPVATGGVSGGSPGTGSSSSANPPVATGGVSGGSPGTSSSSSADPPVATGGVSGGSPGTGSSSSADPPVATGGVSGGSPSTGGTGTCSGSGAVVCNGPNQFGLCNNGNVVWQAVAAGTKCINGQITRRSSRRSPRFRRRLQNADREIEG